MIGVAPVTSWIKGQRQSLGHMRREENNIVKSVMEWNPLGKRPGDDLGKGGSIQSKKI